MTYYEELGLSPFASEAEVKRSYKRLTLLLHPDQHQDPETKALADLQMKRLNEIVAVLSDPERRRMYDQELLADLHNVRQNNPLFLLRWLRNNRGWILVTGALFLFVGAALLIPDLDPARPTTIAQVQSPVSEAKPPVEHADRVSANKPAVRTRRPAIPAAVPAQFPKTPVEPFLPDAPLVSAKPQPPAFSPGPVVVRPPGEATSLAGKWVFTPDPMDRPDPKSFPAEYVELTILISDGRLRGSYRSRYKLPDHSLSPHVNFSFEGAANAVTFDWRGDGGARGQITLRLQSDDTLSVNWFASKMGSELSLGSGSATVYRFR
ncbi:MAG TPA: DnaJ domain-containing protein [Bryobacteraceae bacterium]|nr:DnaJ domain-containing protein [Bryobacteraceae bacterium]